MGVGGRQQRARQRHWQLQHYVPRGTLQDEDQG